MKQKPKKLANSKEMHERRVQVLKALRGLGWVGMHEIKNRDEIRKLGYFRRDSKDGMLSWDFKAMADEGLISIVPANKRRHLYCITPIGENYLDAIETFPIVWKETPAPLPKTDPHPSQNGSSPKTPIHLVADILMHDQKEIPTALGRKDRAGVIEILGLIGQSEAPPKSKSPKKAKSKTPAKDELPSFDELEPSPPGELVFHGHHAGNVRAKGMFEWEIKRCFVPVPKDKKAWTLYRCGEQFGEYDVKAEAMKDANEYEKMESELNEDLSKSGIKLEKS